jgi:thiamine-monophosphate kinase
MSNRKTSTIESIGKFGLIERLTNNLTLTNPHTVLGVGDDSAIIELSDKESLLLTTDLLVEGIHFNLMYVPLKHLGYKAVSIGISDICAMNGKAEQITVSIAVSSKFPVEALDELYDGINLACDDFHVDLVGGDMSSSVAGLVISISAVGRVESNKITLRSGAKANDIIMVSGTLGASYLGLQILERENEVFKVNPVVQPELDGFDALIKRQLKPEARIDIVELLENLGIVPTSMIDISDGLASDLFHLCEKSNLGCQLFEEKIPMDDLTKITAIDFNISPTTCALNGGEDYELLFTVAQIDFEKIAGNPSFTPIGYMITQEEGKHLIDSNGELIPLKAQGWQ